MSVVEHVARMGNAYKRGVSATGPVCMCVYT
jgi:hypothetical protein